MQSPLNVKFVNYHVQNNPPLVPTLIQINSICNLQSHFFDVHFNIIFPSMPNSSKWSNPFRLLTKTLDVFLSTLIHTICSTYLSIFELISQIISCEIPLSRLNIKCTHHWPASISQWQVYECIFLSPGHIYSFLIFLIILETRHHFRKASTKIKSLDIVDQSVKLLMTLQEH